MTSSPVGRHESPRPPAPGACHPPPAERTRAHGPRPRCVPDGPSSDCGDGCTSEAGWGCAVRPVLSRRTAQPCRRSSAGRVRCARRTTATRARLRPRRGHTAVPGTLRVSRSQHDAVRSGRRRVRDGTRPSACHTRSCRRSPRAPRGSRAHWIVVRRNGRGEHRGRAARGVLVDDTITRDALRTETHEPPERREPELAVPRFDHVHDLAMRKALLDAAIGERVAVEARQAVVGREPQESAESRTILLTRLCARPSAVV